MLSTLATARPQGSVRGLKAADKADAILWHIAKQRGDKTSRLMLASAAAVLSYQPMPTSSPMFLKVQCARAVWRLLKSDFIQLYGRRHRQKIGLQSRFVALELFKRVEPVLYFWLKDGGRAAITRKVAGQSACQNLDTPHL
jgi:hypothetical protein